MSTNIVWHHHSVTRAERQKLNGHNGVILWFTGLSGSGKSTLANALDHALHQQGKHSYVLDGDNIRHGLCKDLGDTEVGRFTFSPGWRWSECIKPVVGTESCGPDVKLSRDEFQQLSFASQRLAGCTCSPAVSRTWVTGC